MATKSKRDILLILCALGAAGLLFLLIPRLLPGGAAGRVEARVGGELVLEAPLITQKDYELLGEGGARNVLRVEEGKAYMLEANCPDQLCVLQGAIDSQTGSIVCLPHRLVVRLTGTPEDPEQPDVILR